MKRLMIVAISILLLLSGCSGRHITNGEDNTSLRLEESVEDTVSSEQPITQKISIPEGYTLARIGLLLEEKNICTADEFIVAARAGDFSDYPLIAEQKQNAGRCFKLEGYLFPDTYEIYIDESPDAIIRRMVERFEQKLDSDLRVEIENSSYSIDEIIILASIIEKEAVREDQMPTISSVFHNRLSGHMKLESDVTTSYVEGAVQGFVATDAERFKDFYSTYEFEGLPAGPICNPGLAAIKAALKPEKTNYLYFVADADKNYYYAASNEEHQQNVEQVRAVQNNDTSSVLPQTLTITIPEGYTLPRIGMLLEEMKICTADEFIAAAQSSDFSGFPLVTEQRQDPKRCFKLEGYLFPDTYEIYQNESPDAILRRMLQHTEQKMNNDLRAQIKQSGYTTDEIITLASIIEKEAFGHNQMTKISSVLHNRLDSDMRLQCDVTIVYVEGAIKNFITGDINRYNSYYNTYKCNGLPAGAICNPGLDAIKAALEPENTEYLYFITDKDKNYHYAATWEEHLQNIEQAKEKE